MLTRVHAARHFQCALRVSGLAVVAMIVGARSPDYGTGEKVSKDQVRVDSCCRDVQPDPQIYKSTTDLSRRLYHFKVLSSTPLGWIGTADT